MDRSALDRIMELTSGVRVSAHVPVPATNRQNVVIRRGMSMTAVAPVWEGITIIPDEVTQAKKGQLGHNSGDAVCHEGATDRRWLGEARYRPFLIN